MDTKKLASVKSLLLRAWRERWPDTYWSIQAKHMVSNETTDQAGLADLLLQQAMVGSSPNLLLLSYFKHAINTQMIPYYIGLEGIAKFEDVSKVYCIKALVEVVEGIIPQICSKGTTEDSFILGKSSLHLFHWILRTIQKSMQKMYEDTLSAEYATVATKACGTLDLISENEALVALLYVHTLEDKDTYQKIMDQETKLRSAFGNFQSQYVTIETRYKMEASLEIISKLGKREMENEAILNCSYQPLNTSINVLLQIEAVQNPTGEISPIAEQLLILRKVQGLTIPRLMCEILRTCFMGMINSSQGTDELKWAAFTYLKVPQIFVKFSQSSNFQQDDVLHSLDMFLNYIPLLDLTDLKSGVDCLQLICSELSNDNIQLLAATQSKRIMDRRKSESQSQVKLDTSSSHQSGLPCPNLILRAEPTVKSLLKTLETDYSKNLEGLCSVMGQMMAGKSFELLLTAAAYTGKLQAFAAELIKFNDFAQQSTGESGRVAQTRAYLFDIMFLMLCHIAQTYSLEICHSNDPALESSFFVFWAQNYLPEDNQYKPLDPQLSTPDDQKIEGLLSQIQPGGELKISLTRWNEVCINLRFAIQEVLYAWEYGALTQGEVVDILNNVKSKMCCLSVAIATFLCSYINSVDHERRQKPIFMLEQLLIPYVGLAEQSQNTYFTERCNIMQIILQKLSQDVLPIESSHHKTLPHAIPRTMPIQKVLDITWKDIFKTGSINGLELQKLETILNTAGCQWFCTSLVKEMLKEDRVEDLYKGACILYSLFSLDLPNLTLCLLRHTIPGLLYTGGSKLNMLIGPRGLILAKLAVSCMLLMLTTKETEKGKVVSKKSRKRTRTELELEDSDLEDYIRPSKMRKSESSTPLASSHDIDHTDSSYVLLDDDEDDKTTSLLDSITDPLSISTASLLRIFDVIVHGKNISEKTHFIKIFLEEVLKSGEQLTRYVVQFMPPSMVMQLIKLMPSQFDLNLLLYMCDLTTSQGRKTACKVLCQHQHVNRPRAKVIP